jgi:hypothetical protein
MQPGNDADRDSAVRLNQGVCLLAERTAGWQVAEGPSEAPRPPFDIETKYQYPIIVFNPDFSNFLES